MDVTSGPDLDLTWADTSASDAPWTLLCPEWVAAAGGPYRVLWSAVDPGLLDLARQRMATILGAPRPAPPAWMDPAHAAKVEALAQWPTSALFDETERAVIAFAEQFVMDVGSMDDGTRRAVTEALGDGAVTFAQALYLVDLGLRLDMVLPRLFGVPGPVMPGPPTVADARPGDLWASVQPLSAAAGRMHRIDPLTVELARLRLARTHRCRICSSRRNLSALDAVGGDVTVLDEVDRYEDSGLSERHKVALRLTDVLITAPASLDEHLVAQVRDQFTPAEALELVLRDFRNAVNKFAVALGTDEAKVPDGIELFDVDAAGTVVASKDEQALRQMVGGLSA